MTKPERSSSFARQSALETTALWESEQRSRNAALKTSLKEYQSAIDWIHENVPAENIIQLGFQFDGQAILRLTVDKQIEASRFITRLCREQNLAVAYQGFEYLPFRWVLVPRDWKPQQRPAFQVRISPIACVSEYVETGNLVPERKLVIKCG